MSFALFLCTTEEENRKAACMNALIPSLENQKQQYFGDDL